MPSLFGKSGSTSGRAKARNKSIRGTISAPIPIPTSPNDPDFPIRTNFPIKPAPADDEEFPMRTPGTGAAMPLPPNGDLPDELLAAKETMDPVANKEQQIQAPDHASMSGSSSRSRSSAGRRREQETKTEPIRPGTGSPPSTANGPGGSAGQEFQQKHPATPQSQPPSNSNSPADASGRPPSRPPSRSPTERVSSTARKASPLRTSRSSPPPPFRRATNPVLGAPAGSAAATMRYSVVSDVPSSSRQTAQSKDGPQRKKSTFRSVLGRIFGHSKKKPNSAAVQDDIATAQPEPERQSRPLGPATHHRSVSLSRLILLSVLTVVSLTFVVQDPTALGRPGQRSPKRSVSLPLSEYDRPLRSHSIGPDDILAIESARNSLHMDSAGFGSGSLSRRRAATTAGRSSLSRPHPAFHREFGAGLSPRPASAHGRGSRAGGRSTGEPDPSEIGRAITSDSGGGLRRRSRSLSGLQDFAAGAGAGAGTGAGGAPSSPRAERRRSDEIRYWRESYDPGFLSPLSSTGAQDDIDDTAMGDVVSTAPGSPGAAERPPPKTPPQPFNFGLLPKQMVGMRITQAADLDTRLSSLETRTLRLEGAVDKLYHHVAPGQEPGFDVNFASDEKDAAAGTRPTSSRRSIDTDAQSHMSIDPYSGGQTGFLQPPPVLVRPVRSSSLAANALSPTFPLPMRLPDQPQSHSSISTIRAAAASSSTFPAADSNAAAAAAEAEANLHRDTLIAQLRRDLDTERAARLRLEAQVKKLAERVNTLSSTMFAMVKGPGEARSHERLVAKSSSPSLAAGAGGGGSSPLTARTMSATSAAGGRPAVPVVQREEQLSVFETDDDDEDEDDDDDDGNGSDEDVGAEDTTAETLLTRHETASSSRLRRPTVSSKASKATKAEAEDEGDVTEDDFQTPREERIPVVSYGAFGEELRPLDYHDNDDSDDENGRAGGAEEDEQTRKKAARTLSLSQLTLGKGQRAQV
ncbi:hypothetical protein VTJ49DRAFT_4178 [Mycothermus thermophilus]|uniref:Uncharacterized protein n=1 Tax=Humicola insolens TaxID=85995 RepID=A0ABR3V5Z1_HUMIN